MAISLGNALKSVKDDEHWIKKTIIGGLIFLISAIGSGMTEAEGASVWLVAVGMVLYIIFYAILLGFYVSATNQKLNNGLVGWTEWTDSNILFKGLKCMFSYLVYTIVVAILYILLTIAIVIISGAVIGLISYLINLVLPINQQALSVLFTVLLITVGIITSLYLCQFMNVAYLCYCNNFKFHDLMALKKQFRIIKENQHASWTLIGKSILFALLFILISAAVCITLVGIVTLPFIYFAGFMVLIELFVQYGKEIELGRYLH